jgi:hypothetical protein
VCVCVCVRLCVCVSSCVCVRERERVCACVSLEERYVVTCLPHLVSVQAAFGRGFHGTSYHEQLESSAAVEEDDI